MCGTSHDALDIADVTFKGNEVSSYTLHSAQAIALPERLKKGLDQAERLSGLDLAKLDVEFATFCASCIKAFIEKTESQATFIASHGVTVFHQPENSLTIQIGSGAVIAALSNLPVVSDFRQQDVTLSGQGAPLVPFCDQYLFQDFNCTINLGGFANVSFIKPRFLGYDICACNLLLNFFCKQHGLAYDAGGKLSAAGQMNSSFLAALNDQEYFNSPPPKSLGMEWIRDKVSSILETYSNLKLEDALRTVVEHIAIQIGTQLTDSGSCLITGGGAHNHFLIERIKAHSNMDITVPTAELIDFKEAICFAFLGHRRLQAMINIDPAITGSSRAVSAGAVYLP